MDREIYKMLIEMERFRESNSGKNSVDPDWCIRLCQSIVARHAGYKDRSEWEQLLIGGGSVGEYRGRAGVISFKGKKPKHI